MTTSRQRLLAVLHGQTPDCVPACPDISNMIPARLTGKPFWDIYVYQDPPLWKAYIDAARYFDIDAGFELYDFGDLFGDEVPRERRIVDRRSDGSFVTREFYPGTGEWSKYVEVHTAAMPPATLIKPESLALPAVPDTWEEIRGIKPWPKGMELWKTIKQSLGEQGVLGMPSGMSTLLVTDPDDIYEYHDNPAHFRQHREEMIKRAEQRMETIGVLAEKPDFLFCGASGSLVWQSPRMFRELALPVLKRVTEMAFDLGIPTHVHSCGPQRQMVKMAVEETKLTVIDPLEVPPMGDCDLAELKRLYGNQIVLKGNLHTTDIMLRGSREEVVHAARKCIAAAAAGGGFILSTGDQTPRDTPFENIFALVETARTYGKY
jgi:uroporphyrinogen decarboxylase